MKYYSDEIVKQIIKDTMRYTMTISQSVPMSAEHYPSIEIPDKHGRLIDAEEAISHLDAKMMVIDKYSMRQFLNRITTVLEATE